MRYTTVSVALFSFLFLASSSVTLLASFYVVVSDVVVLTVFTASSVTLLQCGVPQLAVFALMRKGSGCKARDLIVCVLAVSMLT